MNARQIAKIALRPTPPLYRVVRCAADPYNRGHRLRAAAQAARFEVTTRGLKRPLTVPLGQRSKIVAYPAETNSPHAVYRNPPNAPEMFVWQQRLRPGDLFVDVGANIGIYTILALDLGAEAIAVEPNRRNAERVREHLTINGYAATVHQKALSDRPGVVHITEDLDSYNHLVLDGSAGAEVEATTLDALLGERTAAGVKIDVEGAERLVLEGAVKALSEQRIELLQLEWSAYEPLRTLGQDREPVAALLQRYGYFLHRPDATGRLHAIEALPEPGRDVFAAPARFD